MVVIIRFFQFVKKIIIATLLIYSFDMFTVSLNLSVPINIFTIFVVTIFEIPAIICLLLFSLTF